MLNYNKLISLRKKLNLTQEDLAQKLNISRSALGMYEQGRREPDFDLLTRIANVFNVTTDYLLDVSEEDTSILNFNKIKMLRKKANLTQHELADKVGINRSTLGMVESGGRNLNYNDLIKIADFFNVSIDYLLDHERPIVVDLTTLNKKNFVMIINKYIDYLDDMSDERKQISKDLIDYIFFNSN